MSSARDTADAFVTMAHRIVWCTVATVDPAGRPRTRVLHPIWQWNDADGRLEGWIATSPTPIKRADLAQSPNVSLTYWSPDQDVANAECHAEWAFDDETRTAVWNKFKDAPAPVGYDPAIIPPWRDGPTGDAFAALHLVPWRVRVMPAAAMTGAPGVEIKRWRAATD